MYSFPKFLHSRITELIETLWNVNDIRHVCILPDGSELIETLWNVNPFAPRPQI